MKRLIISSLAAALLIAPMAQAQEQRPTSQGQQKKVEQQIRKNKWKKGGKLPSPGQRAEFKDYGKHGLRSPGKGQRWVSVDGQYLLITIATGAILSVANPN
jgi:Ni/Co efflux regulator RcnB